MYRCRHNALFELGERFAERAVQYAFSPSGFGALVAETVDHINHLFRVRRSRLAFVLALVDLLSTKIRHLLRARSDKLSRLEFS